MSVQQRCYSILGDSNVNRNMTSLNRRASPLMEDCQVISCRKLSTFADSLRSIRTSSNSCIVACITNFLTDLSARGTSGVANRIEPVLSEVREILSDFSTRNPDVMIFLSPPMYRQHPEWYCHGLPEVLRQFSKSMGTLLSPGFHLLPSFQAPDLESDGVHLTPYAGLKYVVHLFDSSLDLVTSLSATTPVIVAKVSESARVLEDRVVVLEQGQQHLRQELQMKTAIDSELADFEENVRNECYFVIAGLPPVPSHLVGRDWQNHAKGLVQAKIKLVLGRESKIVVVSGLRRDDNPIYLVKLESTDDSKRLRDRFGSSFKAGADPLPPGLSGLSIRIRLTHASRVRINIMQALASNYKKSNPGSKTQVVNYLPRPLMRLTPPPGSSDPRVMSFNFIESITKLPIKFSKKDKAKIMQSVSGKFKGQLRSLFVVISDDDRYSRHRDQESSSSGSGESSSSGSESDNEVDPPVQDAPARAASAHRSDPIRMETDQPPTDRRHSVGDRTEVRTQAIPTVSASRSNKRGAPSSSKQSRSKSHRH